MLNKGFSTEDLLSAASGGNSTHLYTDSGDYKIHKFTADGTFTVNIPTILFDILVIAGGGSGAGAGSFGPNTPSPANGGGNGGSGRVVIVEKTVLIASGVFNQKEQYERRINGQWGA